MPRDFLHSLGFSWKKEASPGPSSTANSSSLAQTGPESTTSTLDDEKLGLFPLAVPRDVDTEIDIIAVHGLIDNPFSAWQEGGKLWLQDPAFLPKLIPSARILTYGYNSSVALSQTFAGVDEFAELLLNYLEQERKAGSARGRPIVFICHSLGGIVVKKALVVAHERSPTFYKDIVDNIKGVVFMGVPHGGAGIARLGFLFAKLLQMSTAGRTTNAKLVRFLKKDSRRLHEISVQAVQRLSALEIYTFYELETYWGEVIVDKDSARLNVPNEKTFPMNANHSTVCKFSSEESQNFRLVGRAIADMVERIIRLTTISKMPKFPDAGSALHWAVERGRIDFVNILVDTDATRDPANPGADINHVNSTGDTPLMTALRFKRTAIAQYLTDKGADIEAENHENHGSRPLHVAAENGDAEGIMLLVRRQAQTEARSSLGLTPLMHAALRGNHATSKALLESGALIEGTLNKGQRTAAVPGIDIANRVNERSTALLLAAQSGHAAVVKLFVDEGANVEAKTDHDETSLIAASYYGHAQIVRYLLKKGANIEARTRGTFTALIFAANQDHPEVIRTLLDFGALIDAKKSHGMTALMEAIYCERLYSAQLLVERGASLDETADAILGMMKATPLHIAARRGNRHIILALVGCGADMQARTANGLSPLEIANRSGQHSAARLLLDLANVPR